MRARADDLLDARRLRHRLDRRDDGGSFRLGGLEHGERDGVRRGVRVRETPRVFARHLLVTRRERRRRFVQDRGGRSRVRRLRRDRRGHEPDQRAATERSFAIFS